MIGAVSKIVVDCKDHRRPNHNVTDRFIYSIKLSNIFFVIPNESIISLRLIIPPSIKFILELFYIF